MRRIGLAVVLAVSLVAAPRVGEAQRAEIPKVGVITPSSRDTATSRGFQEAFERGLRELGWNPGRNIVIEYRFAEGSEERLSALATELARLPADIIVTRGMAATRFARRATTTIPIVMSAAGGDPVQGGFVSSLARPGGNITGLTLVVQELDGKRLQIIKETIPRVNRVAFLANQPHRPTTFRLRTSRRQPSHLVSRSQRSRRARLRISTERSPPWPRRASIAS